MEDSTLTKVCRACLTEEGEMKSVFVSDERTGTTIHLAEMIMAYASVQITLGDGLPEQICLPCAEKVSKTYVFKQLCEESDILLRQRFGKSPYLKEDDHDNVATEEDNDMEMCQDSINIVIKPEFNLPVQSDDEYIESIETLDDEFQDETINDDSDSDYKPKKNAYKCDICKKSFNRQSQLSKHRSVHIHSKQYACDNCDRLFPREEQLLKHKLTHSNDGSDKIKSEDDELLEAKEEELSLEGDEQQFDEGSGDQNEIYKCPTCSKEFLKKDSLTAHLRTHVKTNKEESVLICHVCSKKFMKPSHLTRHLKIHATVKAHICSLCTKGFARSEQLMNHMNVHSGIKPHVCTICNKGFNQISNLKDHLRTHNGEKPFLCSTCGKGFNQLGNLRQHTIRHSGIKAHLCSICGNGFASKGELGAHLRKHTGARPFVCSVCNHGFTTSSSLTKHKRIHSGEKPYQCEVCKMKFSRSGILARHKRTHTGEKPYVCKFCGKAFAQSNDLSSHLRIHTGEKPFICDICGQAFRQSSALKTHKKTHMDRTQILPHSSLTHSLSSHISNQILDNKAHIERVQQLGTQIERVQHLNNQLLDNKAAIAMMHTTLLNNHEKTGFVNVNVSLPSTTGNNQTLIISTSDAVEFSKVHVLR